nr:hypothetical protein [Sinorhizobium meliloti]
MPGAETHEGPSHGACGGELRCVRIAALPPQETKADEQQYVHRSMKDSVGHHLEAQVSGAVRDAREQVMPLQDLVQEDSVENAADRQAESKAADQP